MNGGQFGGNANNGGPLDPRQFGATLNNTINELQALRNQVAPLGRNQNLGLGEAIQSLNEALTAAQSGNRGFGGDLSEIEKIANQIMNPLREAEIELSRSLQSLVEKDKIRAAMEDEIPAASRGVVTPYLEAIGKGK